MSKFNLITITTVGLLMLTGASQAEMRWSTKAASMAHGPQMKQGMMMHKPGGQSSNNFQAGGHANMRRGKTLFLQDSADAKLWMITPTLEERSLTLEDDSGKLKVPSTGMVSYHALVASRQEDTLHESALRYEYLRGKPTDFSPADLMANIKLPLEIVPDPMAREHWRFYSQNEQDFIVRFNGKPVQGAWVGLKTSNRSELESITDSEGRVSFVLPDDFKNIRTGRRNNRPAEYTIRTGYVANEKGSEMLYRTNFTAPYSVNPSHWKSSNVGLFMLLSGFAVGLVVMRRSKPEIAPKKKGTAK